MAYCAICGRHHDPGIGCADGTQDLLKDAGAGPAPVSSREEFSPVSGQADKRFLRVLVWALAIIVVLFIVATLARKSY